MSILIGYKEDAFADDREDVVFGFPGDIAIPKQFDPNSEGVRKNVEFFPYEDKVIKGSIPYRKGMTICPLIQEYVPGIKPKQVVTDVFSAEANSAYMALLKYDAGTRFKVKSHEGFVAIVVMQGDYSENGVTYQPGQLLVHAPKTGEVTLGSENGCVLLVSRYKPVEGELPEDKALKFDFKDGVNYPDNLEFTTFDGTEPAGDTAQVFRPYVSVDGAIQGLSYHVLFNDVTEAGDDPSKGADLAFLKYVGGSEAAAKLHHHQGYETVLVMQGDYIENGASFPPGHLVVRVPGTHHEMTSVNGCVIFASRRKPVQGTIGRAKELSDAAEAKLRAEGKVN